MESTVLEWILGFELQRTATLPALITNTDQGVLASYSVSYNNSSPLFYLATTSGASLASNTQVTTVPGQASPVLPMLQRQDGNFIGTVSSSMGNFMIGFTPSGGTLFNVSNDTPLIATADDGVIGASGMTYDKSGNVTGQVTSQPIQSITGNAYQTGSIDQIVFQGTALASNFAVWPWGGSNTAVKQQWFPPLDPNYAIYNALTDLINRLQSTTIVHDPNSSPPGNPTTVGALAQTYVFQLLGGNWTTSGLISYLTKQKPRFYNGLTSSYCSASLETGGLPCSLVSLYPAYQTVSADFQDSGLSAESDTPSNPLLTFFRPTSILYPDAGQNLGNEALIFHEALHGWTEWQDLALLEAFYGASGGAKPICQITVYIENYVLSESPGLNSTANPCP
jgi:hypothetical protein